MSIVEKTTHADEIEDLQLEQFKQASNMNALIASYIDRVQELETEIFRVRVGRWLSNATGVQLDSIGEIVDQTRQGRDDAEYRLAIEAQILANKSQGHIDELLEVFGVFDISVTYQEFYNAAIVFTATITEEEALEVYNFLYKAKAGGVALSIIFNEVSASVFSFGATTAPVTGSTSTGFAGATGTNGGHLLGVL